jgi:hypothetical protein
VLAGATYDRSQSYEIVIWGMFAVLAIATLLNALLIKPWNKRRLAVRVSTAAAVHT